MHAYVGEEMYFTPRLEEGDIENAVDGGKMVVARGRGLERDDESRVLGIPLQLMLLDRDVEDQAESQ